MQGLSGTLKSTAKEWQNNIQLKLTELANEVTEVKFKRFK